METLSVNEADFNFSDVLLKTQKAPVQIIHNGSPVAVIMSPETYEAVEEFKLRYLKEQIRLSRDDIANGLIEEGEVFFSDLLAGKYD